MWSLLTTKTNLAHVSGDRVAGSRTEEPDTGTGSAKDSSRRGQAGCYDLVICLRFQPIIPPMFLPLSFISSNFFREFPLCVRRKSALTFKVKCGKNLGPWFCDERTK